MKYFLFTILTFLCIPTLSHAADVNEVRDIIFPVDGDVFFKNDYYDARSGGRTHEATDMIGEKLMPLVSAVDGRVTYQPYPEPSWGWATYITDDEGYRYGYLHINNDTPGTDDGQGGLEWAFAPGVERGAYVTAGQFIAYMGDSGNAESVGAHLHFEIRAPDGTMINPYYSLTAAQNKAVSGIDFSAAMVEQEAETISRTLQLETRGATNCTPHSLIKGQSNSAVYYCGIDGKRYTFPNSRVFFTWYDDFDDVETITDSELASIQLGGNVTYRPGTRLIKITSDPKVYAIDSYGVLRWVSSEAKAQSLYGDTWADLVEDVDVSLFINYKVGEKI